MTETETSKNEPGPLSPDHSGRIRSRVEEIYPDLFRLYTTLHAAPELSGCEELTARRMARELSSAGIRVTEGIGGYGVVGVLENGDGPAVMVRADLDALPIEEKTGLPYASTARGLLPGKGDTAVMHACGHDVHMAVLAGTALLLAAMKESWKGTLVFVCQPKEEIGAGAQAMIDDGLFVRFPRPDAALALHVAPALPAGAVGYREGLFWAGCASLELLIRGIGGHGSRPHETRDPVVMAAETVLLLQTIVSRETDPAETAVLTVGAIHGGSKGNIIPEEVLLQVNYRYFTPETDRILRAAIERTARGVALAAGVPEDRMPVVTELYTGPPICNDPNLTGRVAGAFRRVLGNDRVVRTGRWTFSDDFSRFGLLEPPIPLCYFLLGAGDAAEPAGHSPGIHNPSFAPPSEPVVKTGVMAMTTAVLEALQG